MGAKSQQKKQYIRETARRVFMEKGFKNVTMKDVVDACGISRGGLYLYYGSTSELFIDVLEMEAEDSGGTFAEAISRKASPGDILELFLNEQKKELLRQYNTLAVAGYEYAFQAREQEETSREKILKEDYFKTRFQEAVMIIEHLIREGIRTGEFSCDDPYGAATNIMYTIEGLKICARTMGIAEETVDNEMHYLMARLTQ